MRLSPRFGGAIRIAIPCSRTKSSRIWGPVFVGGGDRLEGLPRARRVPEPPGRSGAREGIGALGGQADGRTDGQNQPPGRGRQEVASVTVRLTACPSVRRHGSPTRRTEYPACAHFAAGEPPGHMTISPPSATIIPPYHTHHTSGLMVNRNTACSVPFTTPPSTTYRSSR